VTDPDNGLVKLSSRLEREGWQKLVKDCDVTEWQRRFLRDRWLQALVDISSRERKDGNFYILYRSIAILGGLAVSALAGVQASVHLSAFRWIVFGLGFVVAAAAAIEQLAHYGPHRLLRRRAREALKSEGSKFFFQLRDYQGDHQQAFSRFATRVESIIAQFNQGYESTITDTTAPVQEGASNPNG
jgi:hypothetical protein